MTTFGSGFCTVIAATIAPDLPGAMSIEAIFFSGFGFGHWRIRYLCHSPSYQPTTSCPLFASTSTDVLSSYTTRYFGEAVWAK